MKDEGHVLVIGAASMDIKGRPDSPLIHSGSTPGRIRSSVGGVARNIAENLARLEVATMLLTVVGDDSSGEHLIGQATASGIDTSEVLVVPGQRTGAYVALLDENGVLEAAIDDMTVLQVLTPRYLYDRRRLFRDARMVVIDANLTPEAMETVIRLCEQYSTPLGADPTSPALAHKLCPYLDRLYMTTPNEGEAATLCDAVFAPRNRDRALSAAQKLVALGVGTAIITLAEFGAVYANAETKGHVPAISTEIVDTTGGGDAMTAAIIFGLLEGIPLDESVRLGVVAASLTLGTRHTVRPDLSVDLLYDQPVG